MTEGVRLIETIDDFVPLIDLRDIRFLEVSGRALVEGDEEPQPVQMNAGAGRQTEGDRDLVVRMSASVVDEHAAYSVEVLGLYTVEDGVEATPEVEDAFLTQVAVFALYPYIREGLATTAARLRLQAPTLALLKRGSGRWTRSEPETDTSSDIPG